MSTSSRHATELAEELRQHLSERLHLALRLRDLGGRRGYRLFQEQKPKNRHLAHVRPVERIPAAERIAGILVLNPPDLIASKVVAYHARHGQPKSGTDWRDLAVLLLTSTTPPKTRSEAQGPSIDTTRMTGWSTKTPAVFVE